MDDKSTIWQLLTCKNNVLLLNDALKLYTFKTKEWLLLECYCMTEEIHIEFRALKFRQNHKKRSAITNSHFNTKITIAVNMILTFCFPHQQFHNGQIHNKINFKNIMVQAVGHLNLFCSLIMIMMAQDGRKVPNEPSTDKGK